MPLALTKYRSQELRREFCRLRGPKFRHQLCFSVCTLYRFRMTIKISKIVLELLLQRQRTREIIRGEDVPLHLAEDDLDLIQPTGVRRQPINLDRKRQFERRNPGPQLLGGVRRAIVENEMDDLESRPQGALKQFQQKCFKIGECFAAACPGK